MERSRLSRREENNTKKSIAMSLLGIIVILFLVVKFGIPLLGNLGSFLSSHGKNATVDTPIKKDVFVAPPVLDALPIATNSATITISGTAQAKQKVALYINGSLEDTVDVTDDKKFEFNNQFLTTGDNLIQVRALEKDEKGKEYESNFSDSFTISLTKSAPTLSIDQPTDNQTFSKDSSPTTVKGKTDPGVKVTVNDLWAIVDNNGNYSYELMLKGGENKILVKATDNANNTTEKEITVTYNQ